MTGRAEADAPIASAITADSFYGGRLVLRQARRGHRSGTDAILLAAAVAPDFAGRCRDMGAGVGAVGLGIGLLRPGASVTLVERDEDACRLARDNVAACGFAERAASVRCDILDKEARRRALPGEADLVVTNPPFHDPSSVRSSPHEARRAAHVLEQGVTLADWIAACLDGLAAKGTFVAILPATALPRALLALGGEGGGKRGSLGAIAVKSVYPRAGVPAHRVLVRAVAGSRAPFTMAPPLLLHDGPNFTPEAEALHRGEAALAW